jgi:Uma2 family endonuclease
MVVQEKLISADEFWEISHHPDFADKSLELVGGVLVVMSRPGVEHGLTVVKIVTPMFQHVEQHDLGYVTVESGYILFKNSEGRDTVRGPDVAFVAKERAPNGFTERYAPFAPDLAVEVVSPNDLVYDVEEKVDEYLRAGTRLVWVISPRSKTVTVYTPTSIKIVDINGTLDGGDVLPGFSLLVTTIFPR